MFRRWHHSFQFCSTNTLMNFDNSVNWFQHCKRSRIDNDNLHTKSYSTIYFEMKKKSRHLTSKGLQRTPKLSPVPRPAPRCLRPSNEWHAASFGRVLWAEKKWPKMARWTGLLWNSMKFCVYFLYVLFRYIDAASKRLNPMISTRCPAIINVGDPGQAKKDTGGRSSEEFSLKSHCHGTATATQKPLWEQI